MKVYTVTRGGVELTMQLSEEDAKRMKARPAGATVPEADGPEDDAMAEEKAKAPANKTRTPQNK